MITVTQGYKDTMSTPSREWNARLTFTKGEDTLTLTSADILVGSLRITEKVMASDELTVGGTVSTTFEVNILSTSVPGTFQLYGSSCFVEYGLKVNGSYEYIPMGFFDIDEPTTGATVTNVKGFDRIMRTEKPYDTDLVYPATLSQIYADICTKCNIPTDVVGFTNSALTVDTKPLNQSYRTVLGMVTQLAGSFSRMGRDGKLYVKWFEDTDKLFDPSNRITFESRKELVQITGVIYKDDSLETPVEYLAGTKTYPIDLSRNLLLDKNHQYVLDNILTEVNPLIMYPCSGEWVGCPEVEVGDVVVNVDIDNIEHPTPITSLTHVFGGNSSFEANARSGMVQQIIPFTDQIVAKLYRRVVQIVGEEIPDKLQDMVDRIQGVTGGSVVTVNDSEGKPIGHIYMDTDDVNTAQNYILINNEGIAFGNNGLSNPATTAIGIDGQIISGTGYFNSLVTNLISSSLGEGLDLSSNESISLIVTSEVTEQLSDPAIQEQLKGDPGADGLPGQDGADGKSVGTVTAHYYLSTSPSTPSGGSWSTTYPGWESGKYLWTKMVTTYSDDTTSETTPVNVTGMTGNDGADGRGIYDAYPQYYLSTSRTSQTGGSWQNTMPTWVEDHYMWTRMAIVFTNPTEIKYTDPTLHTELEEIHSRITTHEASINVNQTNITALVSKTETIESELGTQITNLSNTVTQTVTSTTDNFERLSVRIGETETEIEDINSYIQRGVDDNMNPQIIMGRSDQDKRWVWNYESGMYIEDGGVVTFEASDQQVKTTRLVVLQSIDFGNHVAQKYGDKYTIFLPSGG